jgi:hypothetical protein
MTIVELVHPNPGYRGRDELRLSLVAQVFRPPDHLHAAYIMSGNGGNKVAVFPELDLAVAITSTNYNTRGMHQQTDKILNEYVLAGLSR